MPHFALDGSLITFCLNHPTLLLTILVSSMESACLYECHAGIETAGLVGKMEVSDRERDADPPTEAVDRV